MYKFFAIGAVFTVLSAGSALAGTSDLCGQGEILDRIQSRFTYTAEHYLKSDMSISDFDRIRENRQVSLSDSQNVERHYCHARAHMSDGKKRDIWYVVESPWGFAGMGDGVTYCVSGLDPYRLHGRFCMSLR